MQMQWSELKELLQLKEAVPGPLTSGLPWGGGIETFILFTLFWFILKTFFLGRSDY